MRYFRSLRRPLLAFMLVLSVGLSLLISFYMIANYWDIPGLYSFLLLNNHNYLVVTIGVFILILPLMVYEIVSVYLLLFDFKFFGRYGLKPNYQSDKMSILNASSLLSWLTLPLCNSFYMIALNSDQLAQTTYFTSLEFISYPLVNGRSITLYINFAIIPLALVIGALTSQWVSEFIGLAKYSERWSISLSALEAYGDQLLARKETYIQKILYYYHILRINQRKVNYDEHYLDFK